ncbi:hypothetical protein [Pseudophaeobacter flagellatus]|uniref:hypothetical protein n=1 Tax=Pseudophaeobacter flagellatus TaxID=2899119 RepID=UPI001E3FAAEB|nr:hypothetical protein [Pseudophaeobacter flagellatus]MCD9146644.1 hypothetical protein [Pseudophaeobacter flagellatus]
MRLRTGLFLSVLLGPLLLSCGRPVSQAERGFLAEIHGDSVDLDQVRLVRGAPVATVTFRRKPRPRETCRERILPPIEEETVVTSSPAAVALFNRIFFVKDWYTEDYMPAYPERLYLVEAMLLAHEMTHVWQWQNRAQTGYHPLRAAAEHRTSPDPYLFALDGSPDFLSYGYEQQGAIVEEYVCCRALAPQAARSKRLHAMLKAVMPVSDLPSSRESDVYLPWKEVELAGICS